MVEVDIITLSASCDRQGYPMYPGKWMRTWVRIAGTSVWVCVSVTPYRGDA